MMYWLKDIVEYIKQYQDGRLIHLGCNSIYVSHIKKHMNKPMQESITFTKSVSIDDNCLWELINQQRCET
jgi:hypothetical protein